MAGTELSGLQAMSFYDPSAGDVVQVDGKYVHDFNFTQERGGGDRGPESPTGGTVAVGDFSELEVEFSDVGNKSQLETWKTGDTPISFVAAGEQAAIQWYETDIITELEEVPNFSEHGNVNRLRVRMVREGHGIHDIHKNTNLLRAVNHQIGSTFLADSWQDADNDNVADGYSFFNTSSEGFSSNIQSFDTNNNGSASFINTGSDVEFPISGVTITGTSQANTIHSSDQTVVRVEERDFNSSVLSSTSTTFNSTGRESTDLTTGSSVYGIRMYPLRVDSTSAVETVRCVEPALRLDGTNAYAEF